MMGRERITDRTVLFLALGFLAVVQRSGDVVDDDGEARALAIAGLIESFCRRHVPDAFDGDDGEGEEAMWRRMASKIASILRSDGTCNRHVLKEHGFSENEIRRYWGVANGLARASLSVKREVS